MLKISSEGRGFSMPPIQEKRYLISSNDLDDIKRYIRDKRRPGAFLGMVDTLISVEEDKDEISMKPLKKRLTKEEKLALSKELAGSAKHFSLEGLRESDRIANREDWD